MTKEANANKAAYMREWRKNNPDKVRAINARYWEKRAQRMSAENVHGKQTPEEK